MAEKSSEKNKDATKATKKPKEIVETDDDFKYIVRMANTDIPGEKLTVFALTSIRGIGNRLSEIIMKKTDIPRKAKIGSLSDEEIAQLEELVMDISESPEWLLNRQKDYWTGESVHLLSTDIEMNLREDINTLKKIRCYRGIRHENGQPVRGQRTRSNGRSGLTMGVSKQKAKK